MVREARGRVNVNLGGIAEAAAFVPWWDSGCFFISTAAFKNMAPSPPAPGGIIMKKEIVLMRYILILQMK